MQGLTEPEKRRLLRQTYSEPADYYTGLLAGGAKLLTKQRITSTTAVSFAPPSGKTWYISSVNLRNNSANSVTLNPDQQGVNFTPSTVSAGQPGSMGYGALVTQGGFYRLRASGSAISVDVRVLGYEFDEAAAARNGVYFRRQFGQLTSGGVMTATPTSGRRLFPVTYEYFTTATTFSGSLVTRAGGTPYSRTDYPSNTTGPVAVYVGYPSVFQTNEEFSVTVSGFAVNIVFGLAEFRA